MSIYGRRRLKKECTSTFTLKKDGKYKINEHQHDPMLEIQTEIMLVFADVDKIIIENPTTSIKNVYDQKEIELVNKYGPELVAAYWPVFQSKDKLSLNYLPTSII